MTLHMVQVDCSHCVLGKVDVQLCMGVRRKRCQKCHGKNYRWIPASMTEAQYDDMIAGDGDSIDSMIDSMSVPPAGG